MGDTNTGSNNFRNRKLKRDAENWNKPIENPLDLINEEIINKLLIKDNKCYVSSNNDKQGLKPITYKGNRWVEDGVVQNLKAITISETGDTKNHNLEKEIEKLVKEYADRNNCIVGNYWQDIHGENDYADKNCIEVMRKLNKTGLFKGYKEKHEKPNYEIIFAYKLPKHNRYNDYNFYVPGKFFEEK